MTPAPAVCRVRAGVRVADIPRFDDDLGCPDLEVEVVKVVKVEETGGAGTTSTSSSSSSAVRALQ